MAKALDPAAKAILEKYKINPKDALWDCHGTPVMYHRYVELAAATAGISFAPPQVLEANGATKSVAIAVMGKMGDRAEWSIGEAAPGNNKNAYPYAMAEKRAKDRVTLKLIGLHGFVYSEDEMQDGNGGGKQEPAEDAHAKYIADLKQSIKNWTGTAQELVDWWGSDAQKQARRFVDLSQTEVDLLKSLVIARRDELSPKGKAA